MSATRTPEQIQLLASLKPTDAEWTRWRERRYVRYWCAALLTMNVHPTVQNRKILREQLADDYKRYEDRLNVLLRRRLKRKSLQAVGDTVPGEKPSNQRVDLHAVVRFAAETRWEDREQAVGQVLQPNSAPDVDQEMDDLTIGQRNTFVRYAALANLLRMALDNPAELTALVEKVAQRGKGKPKQRRSKSSNEDLGALVAEKVREMSESKASPPYGFGQGANADEIAKAQRITDARVW